jgi:PTH2 family peptidyl-tRNA hydrolase
MAQMLYKQVIVIRIDLGMSIGKAIAQGAHVAVLAADKARQANQEDYQNWINEGHKKIVCKVDSLDKLLKLKAKAEEAALPCASIDDFGLTELEPGTTTALAIGPALAEAINPVTKRLELL